VASVKTINVSSHKHAELMVVTGNCNHSLNLHQKPVPDTENKPFWQLSVAATYQSGFDAENAPNRQPQRIHIVELAL
jgi:NADH:ubiquinone oxidoreductase subunit B-like Fe-S oxidoreductase